MTHGDGRERTEEPRARSASHDRLAGLEVAFTGRLASMSHERARALLVEAGARPATRPGRRTDLLVIGSEGWPLREDGRPTRALERARALREEGAGPRIITEDEWLAAIGLAEEPSVIHRLCTATELARLLDLPLARIRHFVRAGLIRPARTVHRLDFFAFREVAAARDLASLIEGGISIDRVVAGLRRVRGWIAEGTDAAAEVAGRAVPGEAGEWHLRLDGGELADVTGQLLLDFSTGTVDATAMLAAGEDLPPTSGRIEPLARAAPAEDPRAWFEQGQRAEESGDLDRARLEYVRSIEAGADFPEVHFNLANILLLLEHPAEAIAEYSRALDLDPEYVEAWNNLGNALGETGEVDAAVRAYERALVFAPDYLDPHYNLAETLWDLGRLDEARGHFWIYLRHESAGPWADRARACLRTRSDREGPPGRPPSRP